MWAERREFPVAEVVEAVRVFAQPELLATQDGIVSSVSFDTETAPNTSTVISPFPRIL